MTDDGHDVSNFNTSKDGEVKIEITIGIPLDDSIITDFHCPGTIAVTSDVDGRVVRRCGKIGCCASLTGLRHRQAAGWIRHATSFFKKRGCDVLEFPRLSHPEIELSPTFAVGLFSSDAVYLQNGGE